MFTRIVRGATLMMAGLTLVAGLLVTAGPAAAQPEGLVAPAAAGQADVGPAVCNADARTPYQSGGSVNSWAWSSGCLSSWDFYFELQRHRAWGWEKIDSLHWKGNGSGALYWWCHGHTYTYRVFGRYTNPNGVAEIDISPTHRFAC
jgi:hypothetical protein